MTYLLVSYVADFVVRTVRVPCKLCYESIPDVDACVIVGVGEVGLMNLNSGFSSAGFCSSIKSVVYRIAVYKDFHLYSYAILFCMVLLAPYCYGVHTVRSYVFRMNFTILTVYPFYLF
jgi:hypothetical protein